MQDLETFENYTDEEAIACLIGHGYRMIRKLPDGSWCGVLGLMFTLSVCVGITPLSPYTYRWCFEDQEEAVYFVENIESLTEIPERRKSLRGHRYRGAPLLIEHDELGIAKW